MSGGSAKKNLTPEHCEKCGYAKHFQRHRIKPGREGGSYRLGGVIALCPNCHAQADEEGPGYTRDVLFEIVRKRLLDWLSQARITEQVYLNAVGYIDACLEEVNDTEDESEG